MYNVGESIQMLIKLDLLFFNKATPRCFDCIYVFIDDIDWWPIREARTEAFCITLRSLRCFVYFQDTKVIDNEPLQVNQCPE